MNIWERNRRNANLKKIRITSESMLNQYKVYKSIELQLFGDYDYSKYARLKNLKEESFLKESGDLKLAVQILHSTELTGLELAKACLCIALNHVLQFQSRAEAARNYKYNKCIGQEFIGALRDLGEVDSPFKNSGEGWLFEADNEYIKRGQRIIDFIKTMRT